MRIAVVEDGLLLRAGLVRLLHEAGHEVVAELDRADGLDATVAESGAELSSSSTCASPRASATRASGPRWSCAAAAPT